MLNNELLSLLLRFYGDHDLSVTRFDREGVDELERKGFVERSTLINKQQFHRITKRGFDVASAAIGAANKVLK